MSFFNRLRQRLTKSSGQIEAGVDALIDAAPAPSGPAPTPAAETPAPPEPPEAPQDPPAAPAPPPEAAPPAVEPTPAQPEPAAPRPETAPKPQTGGLIGRWREASRRAAEAERAQQAATADSAPPAPAAPPDPTPDPTPDTTPRPGLFSRVIGAPPAEPKRALDDAMLEGLEELLIQADMGVETSLRVAANMAEGRFGRRLGAGEIKRLLADEVARILEPVARPLPIYPNRPQVVLVVGVNGSGKTTTIGKLASQLKGAGKSVVIAAGDTFRAAAVEQLQIWGERAGVPVLKADQGTDPASLAYDALAKATADGADMLLIDTAGRLQNKGDLMEELAKIVRVLRKLDPSAPHNTVLVLDATTGQNAVGQVEIFQKVADVSGLVMTKLDGTAKGGVLVALADRFGLPIHAIGVGEAIDDLSPFDPEDFAQALTGAGAS